MEEEREIDVTREKMVQTRERRGGGTGRSLLGWSSASDDANGGGQSMCAAGIGELRLGRVVVSFLGRGCVQCNAVCHFFFLFLVKSHPLIF